MRLSSLQESHNVKYLKEIKRLKSLQKAEAYPELNWASTIYFLWIYLTVYYFGNISSIIDVWLGYIWASENIEIFKVNLRWSKSLPLLQRVAFLVLYYEQLCRAPTSANDGIFL